MKKLALLAFTLFSAWNMDAKTITGPVDYVSPLVGTQSKHALSTGNTYPAIALPWGMNFWVPQTGKMGDGWAYTYVNPEKPDVPLNKNDAFQKVQKRRVQEKR